MSWYEKTVEYFFVRKFPELMACPLAGSAELAGDTIFGENDKLFLVEFKKEANPTSERKKYQNWASSNKILAKNPSTKCHFAVYGQITNGIFTFGQAAYTDFLADTLHEQIEEPTESIFIDNAINTADFKKYLEVVIEEKLKTSGSASTSGSIAKALEALDNVAVVNPKKGVVSVVEAAKELQLEKILTLKQHMEKGLEKDKELSKGFSR